jgi:Asp-tRNA(Asn)/Glu-tRNA(Gln) amidotransferase A subunit family amidase
MQGVLPLASSLDTLGFYTHTPADMLELWKAIGKPIGSEEQLSFGAPQPIPDCDPEMANAFKQSIALLRKSGVTIKAIDIDGELGKLVEASDLIEAYEGARFHEARLKEFGNRLDQPIANLIVNGLKISAERYDDTKRFIAGSRTRFAEIFKSTPVILTPAAVGPAPLGLSTTGDPRMDAPWTALGTPAISIPMPVAGDLPLGLQLTADINQDARVLRAALLLQQRFSVGAKISR